MADYVYRRYYKSVSANASDTDEYVIPNGKTLSIFEFGGNASSTPLTGIAIKYWDGTTDTNLFSTHGDDRQAVGNIDYVGNGTKSIKIVLINDQAQADSLGGYWSAVLL